MSEYMGCGQMVKRPQGVFCFVFFLLFVYGLGVVVPMSKVITKKLIS